MELKFNAAAANVIVTLMLVTLPFFIGLCFHTRRRANEIRRKLAEEELE